jgi:hypothetical protein
MVQKVNGKLIVGHGGGWTGTRTGINRWVDDQLTIVVLCNDEGANPYGLAKEMADILLPGWEKKN